MEGGRLSSFFANWKCMLACFLVSMASFQYGIDTGMIGGIQAMVGFLRVFGYVDPSTPIGYNIDAEVQQLITSLMTLGACIGSVGAGLIGAYVGRRPSLWLACALCAVSDAIMLGTKTVGGLYAGRLLIGIANGFFMTFSQLYIQECAPAHLRGLAIGFFQWWCSVGGLIGTIIDNFTATIDGRGSYMIPLALIYIVPVILAVGMFFIPESPRWLVSANRLDDARNALYWLRPDKDGVEAELADIKAAADHEREHASGVPLCEIFRNGIDRRRTLLSIMAASVNGASGSMFMLSYGTYFFEMAGVDQPFQDSCILAGLGVFAITLSFFLITRVGRRQLLITGILICGLCQLGVAVIYQRNPGTESTGKGIVALSAAFLFFCSGCIAPYAWLVAGEIPSQSHRSITLGLSACIAFFEGWLAAFTGPYFINPAQLNWGPKYGYIWFPISIITAMTLYIHLPETKDRTLEELDEMFAARLPARAFSRYICTRVSAAPSDTAVTSSLSDDKASCVQQVENADTTV